MFLLSHISRLAPLLLVFSSIVFLFHYPTSVVAALVPTSLHFTNMLRTDFGPAASATHIAETAFATSSASASASNNLDTLTIPIVFGAIGAILTLATIVIGIIQIRAARCRYHDAEAGQSDHELEEQRPRRDFAGTIMPSPS
jgi:protein-S-isoprenylcysteine O-methyltransferase Ste14